MYLRLALISLLPFTVPAFAEETLLNSGWKFFRVDGDLAEPAAAAKQAFDEAGWESVTLPHTVRVEAPENSMYPFLGKAWYRRTVTAKPEWAANASPSFSKARCRSPKSG